MRQITILFGSPAERRSVLSHRNRISPAIETADIPLSLIRLLFCKLGCLSRSAENQNFNSVNNFIDFNSHGRCARARARFIAAGQIRGIREARCGTLRDSNRDGHTLSGIRTPVSAAERGSDIVVESRRFSPGVAGHLARSRPAFSPENNVFLRRTSYSRDTHGRL